MSAAVQPLLFTESPRTGSRRLPVVGEQGDIQYFGSSARSLLNPPESTGMDFWSINPYIGCAFGCAYCYARYAHGYTVERVAAAAADVDVQVRQDLVELPAWLAFERRIFVKRNAADVLRRQLRTIARTPARWQALRESGIAIGTATDPYQPAERRFQITRGILEVLAGYAGISVSITTKSPLVTRDIDLLQRIAECSPVRVHMSLITLDRELARRLEPRAPTPEARLRAIARLRQAGIDVGVFLMPVLPGITDDPAGLEALIARVADAGGTHLAAGALRLRASARRRYLPFIEAEFPALVGRYRNAYAGGYNVSERYRTGLRACVERLCAKHGVPIGFGGAMEVRGKMLLVEDGQLGLAL